MHFHFGDENDMEMPIDDAVRDVAKMLHCRGSIAAREIVRGLEGRRCHWETFVLLLGALRLVVRQVFAGMAGHGNIEEAMFENQDLLESEWNVVVADRGDTTRTLTAPSLEALFAIADGQPAAVRSLRSATHRVVNQLA